MDQLQLQMIGGKGIFPELHLHCQTVLNLLNRLDIQIRKKMLTAVQLRNPKIRGINFHRKYLLPAGDPDLYAVFLRLHGFHLKIRGFPQTLFQKSGIFYFPAIRRNC